MSSFNLVVLAGEVAESGYHQGQTKTGTPVCNFSIRTVYPLRDKYGNVVKQFEQYSHCVAYGGMAKACEEFVAPGKSRLFIRGRLQSQKKEDSDGNIYYTSTVFVTDVQPDTETPIRMVPGDEKPNLDFQQREEG